MELDRPSLVVQGKIALLRDQRLQKYAPPKKMARFLPSQFLVDSSLGVESMHLDAQVKEVAIVPARFAYTADATIRIGTSFGLEQYE